MTHPQIIYAKAVGDYEQALILRWSGRLYVGIAYFANIDHSRNLLTGAVTTSSTLRWRWCNTIDERDVDLYVLRDPREWHLKQLPSR